MPGLSLLLLPALIIAGNVTNDTAYQEGFFVGVQTGLEMGKWWGAAMAGNADAYNGLDIVCDQYNKILAAVLGPDSNGTKELRRSKPVQAAGTPEAGGQLGSVPYDESFVVDRGSGAGAMGGCV